MIDELVRGWWGYDSTTGSSSGERAHRAEPPHLSVAEKLSRRHENSMAVVVGVVHNKQCSSEMYQLPNLEWQDP